MIITWDEYFMGIAIFSAYRSKDPHTQVGACDSTKASKRMLASAGVVCRRMETDLTEVPVSFAVEE